MQVILFSGGLDSTALAALYGDRRDLLVSFDYGQRHGPRELAAARSVAQALGLRHEVVDLRSVTKLLPGSALTDAEVEVPEGHYAAPTMRSTVVPNRNAIMLSIAAGIASAQGGGAVMTAVHAGDHAVYPDCRPEFVERMNAMLTASLSGLAGAQVFAPFVHLTKTDIVARGASVRAPFALSWSCYAGGDLHCGRCGTCVERAEAFDAAGVEDPTVYESPDFWRTARA